MTVKLKDDDQDRYPAWENIVLISAKSDREAFQKAEAYGRREEGDEDGGFRWGGKPATWVFAGVRKLTECATLGDHVEDETEVSCNELELDSEAAIHRLVAGRPTRVVLNDRYRPAEPAKPMARAMRVRRKPA
jgi:hypothetical protein